MQSQNLDMLQKKGRTPKGDCSTQPFHEATKSPAQDPRACSLHHQNEDLCYTTDLYNSALNNRLNSTNHFSYPLIKFFVCLNFQFATFTELILSEIKISGEPPAQFDGLYKISQVFGSVLEFNEPPILVPPLREHYHSLCIMLLQQLKVNASVATCQPVFYNCSFLLVGSELSFNSLL